MLASTLIGGATGATPTFAQAAVNNPPVAPHSIFAFPQRDFVSASGWAQGQAVTVQVVHPDGTIRSTLSGLLPKDDPGTPGFDGIVEVNHPGGYCWDTVTPDIRAGDKVRIVVDATGATDEITVQNVTAKRPVQTAPDTVVIHGTFDPALDTASLEQRMVADPKNLFQKNGKRTLRATVAAGSDGAMTIDSPGNWTATYAGLSATDVQLALNSESRILWLGANPAAGVDNTIYENGAAAVAGPSAPCTAPLEQLPPPPGSELVPPSVPTGLQASVSGTSVSLSWTASTDNVGVVDYGILRTDSAGVTLPVATVQNPTGDPPAPTSFTDSGLIAGSYTYAVDAGDAVGNRSAASAGVSVSVAATAPVTATAPAVPHSLIAFPQRDFISATGYTPGTAYTFEIVRNGATVARSTPIVADATGLAEVNHPGGACWNVVTPNILPGDEVRITDGNGMAEKTIVSNVTAERPIVTAIDAVTGGGTVQVHGTAQDALGAPLPIDQIEQRLVARNDSFDINGRRTIRAASTGTEGTLAYDAAGSTRWTATYTLQTPNDLARAVGGTSTSGIDFGGAESRILWLGANPAIGTELTIYENGDAILGGPATGLTGCVGAPAETPAPGASLPASVPTFTQTAVNATSATQSVTLTNNGTAPLRVGRAYLAGLNPGDFTLSANAASGATVAPGATFVVDVAFKPTVAGNRQAFVAFADDAANTTQQYLALAGSTPAATTLTATAPVQSLAALAAGKDLVVNSPLGNSTIAVDVRWTGTGSRSELQVASGNNVNSLGAFSPVTLTPDTATSTTVNLKMGTTTGTAYQFQVRSCNGTTCGAWAAGPKFTLLPADEANMAPTAFKGTWLSEALTGAYGGSVKWAAGSATATIVQTSFTVSGNAAWVSTLGPDRGLAQVQVDNEKPQVIDLYAPTMTPAQIVWARDALPVGNHTVTVTVLGKKSALNTAACNTGTKCARVDIDAAVMIK